jgi:RecB family exonuclease
MAMAKRAEGMLDEPDADTDPDAPSYRERIARNADSIATYVVRLAAETVPPTEATWEAFSRWPIALFRDHVLGSSWTGPEAEAGQLVTEILRSLPSAGAASAGAASAGSRPVPCTLSVLIETLDALFGARRQPVGKFGRGVLTGKLQSASGLNLSRVHVLGMTESAFPKGPPPNPFVPFAGESDPLDDRRTDIEEQAMALFLTVSAAREASLSFPIWGDAGRPVYPSRWLVQAATRLAGRTLTSQQLRTNLHGPWFISIPSPLAGVRHGPEPVDLAEYRLRAVLEWREAHGQLASHPLAARSDLPLQRFLAIGAARASAELTAADGNLADKSLDGAAGDGLNIQMGESQSATRLQTWATCPFRYFLDRMLRVRSTDRPEDAQRWTINALDKGSVIHTILERFYKELIVDGRSFGPDGYEPNDYERLAAIAAEELHRYEEEGVTGHPLVWRATRSAIMADLEMLLRRDGEDGLAGGWNPVAVEQAFGDMEGSEPAWPAVSVSYGASEPLLFRGKIDRIDRSDAGAVRVTDYKTGRAELTDKKLEDDPVVAGTALQLALYGRAVRERMAVESVTARYWYASTKGEFKTANRAIDDEVGKRLVAVLEGVVSGITNGCFPQIPQAETYRPGRSSWENCVYCAFDRICPSGRDAVQDRKRDAPGARAFYELQLEVPAVEE